MPELPEVETIVRGLAPLEGRTVTAVTLGPHDWVRFPPPSVESHLVGRTVRAIRRHGKQIRIHLSPAGELLIHLGMSGVVSRDPADSPPAAHTHLRLAFAGTDEEFRVLGGVELEESSHATPALADGRLLIRTASHLWSFSRPPHE